MVLLLQQTTAAEIQPTLNTDIIRWWYDVATNAAYITVASGVIILLVYFIRLLLVSGNKGRYDFISQSEVRFLLVSSVFFIISFLLFYNREISGHYSFMIMFARVFLTGCVGLVLVTIVQSFLKFYYPFFIEKRLRELRFKPRISPKTGKPMKLLSEEEEDAYLDEGMQAEENVFSVDYDVWKDEESGFIQIEKYSGHLHALRCPECNYQTLKLIKEEILSNPTLSYEGELMKHYQCTYCGHKARKSVVLRKQNAAVETASSSS